MKARMERTRRAVWVAFVLASLLAGTAAEGANVSAAGELNCSAAPPLALHAHAIDPRVTIDKATQWQPRGGEVLFTIRSEKAPLEGLIVRACFGWSEATAEAVYLRSPSVRVVSFESGVVTFGAIVPILKYGGTNWLTRFWSYLRNLEGNPTQSATELSIVPTANLRIMAVGGPLPPDDPLDVLLPIGITSRGFAALAGLSVLLLAFGILYRCRPRPSIGTSGLILTLISTGHGYASLSQFQILLWTVVIGTGAVYVMALSGDLIDISGGALIVLGITGVSTVGAKLKSSQDDARTKEVTAASPRVSVPDPHRPSWADLIAAEDGTGAISMPRVQMLFFTCVSATFVTMKVLASGVIPEIPEGFLLLMGLSNGVYLSNKFV